MSQTLSVFWGSKHHLRHFVVSIPGGPGPGWRGVGVERISCKSQPDKMLRPPRVCAATVTAGGHGGKAPRILLLCSLWIKPHASERGATEHTLGVQNSAHFGQQGPRTELSQPAGTGSPLTLELLSPGLYTLPLMRFLVLIPLCSTKQGFERVISTARARFTASQFACHPHPLPAALAGTYTSSFRGEEKRAAEGTKSGSS